MQSHKTEIKALLFPDANDDHFADAYAHTVMFASFLGHMKGDDGGFIHVLLVVAVVVVLIRIMSSNKCNYFGDR